MRLLDRYIIREIIPPFLIALVVFTFVLIIPFILEQAEQFIAKGVEWLTILRLMATLLPATLGLTIPMALLIGVLVAFGRLSADREVMVLMACGISSYRLLRPVLALATVAAAATAWVMIEAIPDANQTYREITMTIVADRAESQVRPREFFDDFPDTVLYVREAPAAGGWQDVLAADTKTPGQPSIFVARRGRMAVNRESRTIQMVLEDGARHTTNREDPAVYEMVRFEQVIVALDPESVFPRTGPARGEREMTIAELRARIAELQAENFPFHNPVMEIHKKFSIPVACFVFAILGIALGVSHRRDGKLASFVLGIAVIFMYYVIMFTSGSMTKGALMPASLAMWIPNIVLGAAGVALLIARSRGVDRALRLRVPTIGWPQRHRSPATGEASTLPVRRAKTVAVIRLPQLRLPRPSLLDLYVGRTYLRIIGMSVVGIMGLFYISTFIDQSDKWFKGEVPLTTLLAYLWWVTPQYFYYIVAIAVLLAAIVTIGLLTKNSELVVMRACGVSLYRTALPLLFFAIAASGVLLAFEERVLAFSNRRAEYLQHIIRGGNPQTFDVLYRKWVVGRAGEIYHYQLFDPRRRELHALSVLRFDPSTRALTQRTYALQARWLGEPSDPGAWQLSSGWIRDLSGTNVTRYTPFSSLRVVLEPADYFSTEAPAPDRMTFDQLRRYIRELQASGYNVLEEEVELYRKLAFPFVTIVMTLIAVPAAVTTGKRGALYGIGLGIVLALSYWTANSIFAALGAGAVVPPMLAAWGPNLFFGAVAAFLLLTVRT